MAKKQGVFGQQAAKRPGLLGSGLAKQVKPGSTKPGGSAIPSTAPPGSYDPALDAQIRASQRGLSQLREDTGTAGGRSGEDLATALARANRAHERTGQDLNTRETRGNRDFDSQLQGVFRQFGILGHQQTQGANAAGVFEGGTLRAAAKARGANQALARAPIDTARGDLMGDLALARTREGQDHTTDLAGIQQGFDRSGQDRGTRLQRGISEQAFYQSDQEAEKVWSARQQNPDLFGSLSPSSTPAPATGKTPKTKQPTKPKKGKK